MFLRSRQRRCQTIVRSGDPPCTAVAHGTLDGLTLCDIHMRTYWESWLSYKKTSLQVTKSANGLYREVLPGLHAKTDVPRIMDALSDFAGLLAQELAQRKEHEKRSIPSRAYSPHLLTSERQLDAHGH